MNAERLHVVALTLRSELREHRIIDSLRSLVSAYQQIGQSSNASTQQNLVSARQSFFEALTDVPSDSFAPAWRQVLNEIGGEELFGSHLRARVETIIAENVMTPIVAHQRLQEILSELEKFEDALKQLTTAFSYFHTGSEKLASGEAEIALLIPRGAVDDKLADFTEELEKMKFILNTLSEVATGHIDDLKIRTISSSDLMVFLAASPLFGAMIAKVINFVVEQYKKILEIKKLQLEIERLELPEEISAKTKEHANTLMDAQLEKFTVELMHEYKVVDGGRKNELRNAVKVSLDMVANRIDRGFNFEVRVEPPKEEKAAEDEETERAVQTIQGASVNMQYMKLEGPPILALPEAQVKEVVEAEEAVEARPAPRKRASKKEVQS